jgi:hypothetical protein
MWIQGSQPPRIRHARPVKSIVFSCFSLTGRDCIAMLSAEYQLIGGARGAR